MSAAGAEFGEGYMARTGEFDSGGEDGGVEVEDGAKLDFDAELHVGGRESLAIVDPAAGAVKRGDQVGEQAMALFIGEGLDLE